VAKSDQSGEKPADASSPASGPAHKQVREIARLVAKLEAVGDLETRRRRQLQAALEKGHKARRHRQAVDRSVARVGVLIDRLRTLARELDAPVPRAVKPKATAPSKPGPKPATVATPAAAKPTVTAKAKPAASAAKPKRATTSARPAARPRAASTTARRPRPTKAP
jgi:hypothetical protein